jgi:hypothetical protein
MSAANAEDPELHKVTVNLSNSAFAALHWVTGHTGHTRTDAINRALIIMAHLVDIQPGETINLEMTEGVEQLPDRRFLVYRRGTKRGHRNGPTER